MPSLHRIRSLLLLAERAPAVFRRGSFAQRILAHAPAWIRRALVGVVAPIMWVGSMTAPAQAQQPSPNMSFFVTSGGNGAAAGDLGGVAGADARCEQLAAAVGAGDRTWRAYLSTDAVDARDRIGTGP